MSNVHGNEIIFEDGDWKITTLEVDSASYGMFFDKVYHKCPWKQNWLGKDKYINIYAMVHLSHCPGCGTEIPDSIVGVWKLKNFDLLQQWSGPYSGPSFYMRPPGNMIPPPK